MIVLRCCRRILRFALFAVPVSLHAGLTAQEPQVLAGTVAEAGTGSPLAGVLVRIEGQVLQVQTGDRGEWRLTGLHAGEHRIRFERVGFADRLITARVPHEGGPLRVALTPTALPLNTVVVTASRRAQRLADAVVMTQLITRHAIEQARVSDLSTLLLEQTGIQLQGGHPVGESVILQGLGSERILVLLDGQPVVGRLSGQIDLSRFPTSMIERIEIVKGPQSSLYGSEAMGGVINVITREAASERWSASADLTTGSQGRLDVSSLMRGTLGRVRYLADVGRRATDLAPGYSTAQGALAERYDALLKLGWDLDANRRIDASAGLLDERQRWQSGQLNQFSDNRQWSARIGGEWRDERHRITPTFYVSEFEHLSRRSTSAQPVPGTGDREVQRLWEAELLLNAAALGALVDVGIEAKREEIRSDRVVDRDRAMHLVEPFAQASWRMGNWTVVPGARITWSEEWGAHATPSLSTMYRPNIALALRGTVARGYRAPSFKELHMEFFNIGPGISYAVRGNPELRPEQSSNFSFGAEWNHRSLYARGNLFHNNFEDFIETRITGDSSGVTLNTYGNIGRGFTRGIELDAGFNAGGLRAEAGYAYLQTRDRDAGEPLLGRPAHSARGVVEYAFPFGLRAALNSIQTGETPARRTDTGVIHRDGFLRIDLRLSQSLPRGAVVTFGARNLFDERPREWAGFTGRHLYAGLSWRAAPSNASNPSTQIRNDHD